MRWIWGAGWQFGFLEDSWPLWAECARKGPLVPERTGGHPSGSPKGVERKRSCSQKEGIQRVVGPLFRQLGTGWEPLQLER